MASGSDLLPSFQGATNYECLLSDSQFSTESSVIVRSLKKINIDKWSSYIVKNLYNIPPNSKILVLTGFHGKKSGEVGKREVSMVQDFEDEIEDLKEEHQDIISTNNIVFAIEDIGHNCLKFEDLDTNVLVQAIENHHPTIISLGFCFTKVSNLNWLLQSNGIYSKLLLQQDRREITDGKWITLDKEQTDFVKTIVENNEIKDVIIFGK